MAAYKKATAILIVVGFIFFNFIAVFHFSSTNHIYSTAEKRFIDFFPALFLEHKTNVKAVFSKNDHLLSSDICPFLDHITRNIFSLSFLSERIVLSLPFFLEALVFYRSFFFNFYSILFFSPKHSPPFLF